MSATPSRPGPSRNDLPPDDAQRLDELLADRALFGLDAADAAELARLLAATGATDDARYDAAAARAAVALAPADPLPAALRERLLDDAAQHDFAKRSVSDAAPDPSRREWPVYTMFAVAAGLLISFWMGQPLAPTPADERRALLTADAEVMQVAWAPQQDPALAEPDRGEDHGDTDFGDVVWSDKSQRGYLRFRGLRANDPKVEQYQLWVFDAARDDRYPVDGGVFDIPSGADEHVIAIDAKLPVEKAALFAITVEKPGGVVVSDRKRLPLLAKR